MQNYIYGKCPEGDIECAIRVHNEEISVGEEVFPDEVVSELISKKRAVTEKSKDRGRNLQQRGQREHRACRRGRTTHRG